AEEEVQPVDGTGDRPYGCHRTLLPRRHREAQRIRVRSAGGCPVAVLRRLEGTGQAVTGPGGVGGQRRMRADHDHVARGAQWLETPVHIQADRTRRGSALWWVALWWVALWRVQVQPERRPVR